MFSGIQDLMTKASLKETNIKIIANNDGELTVIVQTTKSHLPAIDQALAKGLAQPFSTKGDGDSLDISFEDNLNQHATRYLEPVISSNLEHEAAQSASENESLTKEEPQDEVITMDDNSGEESL